MCVFYGKTIFFLGYNPFTNIIVFRMLLCSNITNCSTIFEKDKISVSTSSEVECLNSSHREHKN